MGSSRWGSARAQATRSSWNSPSGALALVLASVPGEASTRSSIELVNGGSHASAVLGTGQDPAKRRGTMAHVVGTYGHLFSLWEIWRRGDRSTFYERRQASRAWETAVVAVRALMVVASVPVPWTVTGSLLAGLLTFIAANLLLQAILLPIVACRMKPGKPPTGTYWDGNRHRYTRSDGRST
jgi:hypothetical protein